MAFFEAMRPFQAPAAGLNTLDSIQDQAIILWSIFQCHRVAENFIRVKFEGHPAMVKEMSLFMLTERVDLRQIARMEDQLTTCDAKLLKMRDDISKL